MLAIKFWFPILENYNSLMDHHTKPSQKCRHGTNWYGLPVQEHGRLQQHIPHTDNHTCPTAPHCASLTHLPKSPGGSPGDEGQPASHIVLTGVHLLLQTYLPVWDEAPPPTAISRQGQHFTDLNCYGLITCLHGRRHVPNDKYQTLMFI